MDSHASQYDAEYDRLVVALADLRARIPSIIAQARAARAQSVDLRRQREAIAQDTDLPTGRTR